MPLYQIEREADLNDPMLIVHLSGFVDAGGAAEAAATALLQNLRTEVAANFDPDAIMDYRARRPIVRLDNGLVTDVMWPGPILRSAHDDAGHDLLILSGPEPDMRWQEFCKDVMALAHHFHVSHVIGLGAFPGPVPHTRPVRLAAAASSRKLADFIGFVPGQIDVPGGVQTALEWVTTAGGLPSVGLWARVPHYASAFPYPAATVALLEEVERLTGVHIDTAPYAAEAEKTRARIDSLIANSAEHTSMIKVLEEQFDQEPEAAAGAGGGPEGSVIPPGQLVAPGQSLPSGDELAAELERFLRGESGGSGEADDTK